MTASKLGDGIWIKCEQVMIAAQGMAWRGFDLQVSNFPGSHRDKQNVNPWKDNNVYY